VVLLTKIPIGLARGIRGIIACPDPVSIQLAAGVDDLGYGLATGSAATREGTRGFYRVERSAYDLAAAPAAGLDSYRRHLRCTNMHHDE
jgi:hypothetical protein